MSEQLNLNNKSHVRGTLRAYLKLSSKTKQDIDDFYAKTKDCEGLFVEFNKDLPINENKSQWDFDYFFYQLTTLELQFAEKRLFHVMEVREYLRNNGCEKLIYNAPKYQPNHKHTNSNIFQQNQEHRNKSIKTIITVIIVVVVIMVVGIVLTLMSSD